MTDKPTPFQLRVAEWMVQCFTPQIIADKLERADRFIEEALELVQATGYSADRAHALVDYTFNRQPGEPFQEVGGVMVTLAALCNPHGLDMDAAAEAELARIWTKIETIRAKQATKPVGSALPVPTAMHQTSDTGDDDALFDMCRAAFAGGWNAALGQDGRTGTYWEKRADWERDNALPSDSLQGKGEG
jgi:hypothetical protein